MRAYWPALAFIFALSLSASAQAPASGTAPQPQAPDAQTPAAQQQAMPQQPPLTPPATPSPATPTPTTPATPDASTVPAGTCRAQHDDARPDDACNESHSRDDADHTGTTRHVACDITHQLSSVGHACGRRTTSAWNDARHGQPPARDPRSARRRHGHGSRDHRQRLHASHEARPRRRGV